LPRSVTTRAPGKVNLALHVGGLGDDGYHPVATIYQAVDIYEQVTAIGAPSGSGITIKIAAPANYANISAIPTDHRNIAYRAAALIANRIGIPPDIVLIIEKAVPVAGGMAGGSADAAATLVACNELWGGGFSITELLALAAELGSDVPFALLGGTALGIGRGEILTPIATQGTFLWAFGLSDIGLATPTVYRKFDELGAGVNQHHPAASASLNNSPNSAVNQELLLALATGDAAQIGAHLSNGLQPAALALRPELCRTLEIARSQHALGAIVSGSGPTIAALAGTAQHAQRIADAWQQAGVVTNTIVGKAPAHGARIAS